MEATVQYKCPNCGGELKFNADGQNFICEWCNSDFEQTEVEELASTSISPEQAAQDAEDSRLSQQFADDTAVYVCPSCGAEIICSNETAASFCYYCHNPVTLKGRLDGDFRPDLIIPFKYSRAEAENYFKQTCSKKKFLPSDFLTDSQLEKITGLYVPFWLADCDIDAYIRGEATTVSVAYRDGNTYTTTRIYNVDRAGRMKFFGVPADAALKIDDDIMDAIEPYDYKAFTKFSMTYLLGFFADKYDVSKNQVLDRIKERIDEAAKDVLRQDIKGYSSISVKDSNVRILKTDWHYAMLPVWFMTYRHKGKVYTYAINGQTGKMAGKYPVSLPKAFAAAVVGGLAVAAAAILIGGYLI